MALEALIGTYMNQMNNDPDLARRIGSELINTINQALGFTVRQVDMQLDPELNKSLKRAIGGFTTSSTKNGINPSQLYIEMENIYKQTLFGNNKSANIYMLSVLYIRALKKLGYPDPINGKREYATRQERESAQNIVNIIGDLLAKSLYEHFKEENKDVTEEEIAANLYEYASTFYGEYVGIINKIGSYIYSEKKKHDVTLKNSATRLMSILDDIFMSSMESLISTMYSTARSPGAISLILNSWGQYGFYKAWFDMMSGRIAGYISLGPRQPPQQADQHQGGQQVNQSNIQQPPQLPASQQPDPQQQQAPQGGQSANQFRQPPCPHVLGPKSK